jgi:hypothetical protein
MNNDNYMRLFALSTLRGLTQKEKVELLDRAGFGQTEIARLLASTPKAISVRLAQIRKGRRKVRK